MKVVKLALVSLLLASTAFAQANDEQNQNIPGVPDSAATIVLVAAALAGLAAFRRRRR